MYSVYVLVLELLVQTFYLGSNNNRSQAPILHNIAVHFRFVVHFTCYRQYLELVVLIDGVGIGSIGTLFLLWESHVDSWLNYNILII